LRFEGLGRLGQRFSVKLTPPPWLIGKPSWGRAEVVCPFLSSLNESMYVADLP